MKLKTKKLTPCQIYALRVIRNGEVVVYYRGAAGIPIWTNGIRPTSGEKLVKACFVYLEERTKETYTAKLTILGEAILDAIDSVISAQNCISTEERLNWNEVDTAYRIFVKEKTNNEQCRNDLRATASRA